MALSDSRIRHFTVLSRRRLAPHPKLPNVVIDFDNLDNIANEPYLKVDAGICALKTTQQRTSTDAAYRRIDLDYPHKIAQIPRANNAGAFALGSSGGCVVVIAHALSSMKPEAEVAVAKVGFPSLTIVRPSAFAGKRAEARLMEISLFAILHCTFWALPKRYPPVDAKKILTGLINVVVKCETRNRDR